jgi:hypothetical protein
VVVLVASGCSYSEEAEPGVRNVTFGKTSVGELPHLSERCEGAHRDDLPWGCLNESEQQRAAGLFHAVNVLVRSDETFTGEGAWVGVRRSAGTRIKLLKLLIDWEALEVLCYTGVIDSMWEEEAWPMVEGPSWADFDDDLSRALREVRAVLIDLHLSRVTGDMVYPEETPVFEPVRYKHLCPSWMSDLRGY